MDDKISDASSTRNSTPRIVIIGQPNHKELLAHLQKLSESTIQLAIIDQGKETNILISNQISKSEHHANFPIIDSFADEIEHKKDSQNFPIPKHLNDKHHWYGKKRR